MGITFSISWSVIADASINADVQCKWTCNENCMFYDLFDYEREVTSQKNNYPTQLLEEN